MRPRAEQGGRLARARAWLAASAWAPLALRGLAWAAAFVALALVGSGAVGASWLRGPGNAFAGAPPASASAMAPPRDAGASAAAAADASAGALASDAGGADASAPDGGAPAAGVTPDGKIVLNLADEEELRRLPGVGPVRARAILELRARLGRFRRPEELLRVRGLGRRSFARIKPLVVVDPPAT